MHLTRFLAVSSASVALLLASPAVACAGEDDHAGHAQSTAKGGSAQLVELAVTDRGAQPSIVTVKAGQRMKLVVTRKTDSTCVVQIVNKDLGIDRSLPLNEPVTIEVTPAKPGTYRLVCGMGMDVATLKVQ